jgi:hypothetical protein
LDLGCNWNCVVDAYSSSHSLDIILE